MSRRKREPHQSVSPLISYGISPENGGKAVIQVVREIHLAHRDIDVREAEGAIEEAIERARAERGQGDER